MSHATLRTLRSGTAAGAVALALAMAPAPAHAGRTSEALLGTSCALLNLVYGPAKLTYAMVGGLVGGLAYAFSAGDAEVAGPILDSALRGDYALSPEHLQGRRELEFIGRSEEHRRAREAAGGFEGDESPAPVDPDDEW